MAGREQKAREGKWNGGFAPYGYKLVDGKLEIAEDEVEVVRLIYDRYIHTNDGITGVAKYLNDHGYKKKIRQNGTIPGFCERCSGQSCLYGEDRLRETQNGKEAGNKK